MRGKRNVSVCSGHELANALYFYCCKLVDMSLVIIHKTHKLKDELPSFIEALHVML